MRVLIIYDSVFGNTALIAKTIGESLSDTNEVDVRHIDQFDQELIKNTDILIVGSPTRAFSPTRKISSALKKLNSDDLKHLKIAVFDTRININEVNVKILKFLEKRKGYASDSMINILKKKSDSINSDFGKFYVETSEGPLKKDEKDKAALWAAKIVL